MNRPTGVAVDNAGNVFVADANNARVDEFTTSGVFEQAWGWGVAGDARFESCTSHCQTGSGNSGAGALGAPNAIAIGASGDVLVADGSSGRIEEYAPAGQSVAFVRQWGSPGTDAGQFEVPSALAADAAGNVFVVDGDNNRIQEFDSSGQFVRAWGWGVADGGHSLETCTPVTQCRTGIAGSGPGQMQFALNAPAGIMADCPKV